MQMNFLIFSWDFPPFRLASSTQSGAATGNSWLELDDTWYAHRIIEFRLG